MSAVNFFRLLLLFFLCSGQPTEINAQISIPARDDSIPLLELKQAPSVYTVVDRQPQQYLGHPTTVLFADGKTLLAAYPIGHGRGKLIFSRSRDAGDSWQRLKTEDMSVSEVPTLFKLPLPIDGQPTGTAPQERVLLVTCVPKTGVLEWMWSDDQGQTWSPRKHWQLEGTRGIIVALASAWPIGESKWRGVFHDFNYDNWTVDFELAADERAQGGFDCRFSNLRRIEYASSSGLNRARAAGLCEAGVVSSPDGQQLALLFRPQHKKTNSMIAFSNDQGACWSDPQELSGSLSGERHTAKYAPDGRLVVCYRDFSPLNKLNPSHGDWVAWVGTWDDLVEGGEGQCRIRLRRNYGNSTNTNIGDCGYTGVELLPDGRIFAITYGHWDLEPGSTHPNHPEGRGEAPYILQVRFRLDDVDRWLKDPNFRVSAGIPAKGMKR
jgi:hypothetical protein